MNKNNLEQMEFLTSAITTLLLAALTFLQYQKNRPYWWLILIVTILMGANAYIKYKKMNKI
ncbi:hypothetical protein [uncultured Anaerococcus sp.]|uniref:hypothetical protein n=1 Tax=uncultured Anaerococcus sp. TaxID=293428 RepID=UPI0025EBC51D|nr:hypothetical protein [uncultured Anaerococcus sp.]